MFPCFFGGFSCRFVRSISSARAAYIAEYREKFANPYAAAALGYIDEVIRPEDTRPRLIRSLEMLRTKRQELPPKKHGNIPL